MTTPTIRARIAFADDAARSAARTDAAEAWRLTASGRDLAHDEHGVYLVVRLPFGTASLARCGSRVLMLTGNVAFDGARGDTTVVRLAAALDRDPVDALRRLAGAFVLLYADPQRRSVLFATDRAATRSPCYAVDGERFVAGLTTHDVVALRENATDLRPQAIYDYLNFHVIPAPCTIFDGVRRLRPGECVRVHAGRIELQDYWRPAYRTSAARLDFAQAKARFRALMRDAVTAHLDGVPTGTFLSGGTDSSTVAGVLGLVSGAPPSTYSIGFAVEGYDEIGYARIAARHFHAQHHEYYLTPDDLLTSIPAVAASYDQPFGNSSAIAAYFCARLAEADGVRRLLGGDGGDEIFGGNTRYARQKVFDAYHAIPGWIARGVAEPLLLGVDAVRQVPLLRKARSYVEQARCPMPARMHTYNLIDRIGRERIFDAAFLAAIDPDDPARQQAEYYARCDDPSLVNRMLHYDWKFTLSDNDLPKVVGACDLAGVDVGFPFLDERIVEFANALPAHWKVRRLRLRHFFKEALADFLPPQIIAKKKHGFGLPFGHWLVTHDGLRRMALGSLESLRDRRVVETPFFDELLRRVTTEHAGFYGELVWILMMLEQWLGAHRPGYRFR